MIYLFIMKEVILEVFRVLNLLNVLIMVIEYYFCYFFV